LKFKIAHALLNADEITAKIYSLDTGHSKIAILFTIRTNKLR